MQAMDEQPEPMMTTAQVARWLAIPVGTVHRWQRTGDGPPSMRVGKHLRFDPQEVREWMREQAEKRRATGTGG